jgi:hypothetical protein
LTFNGLHGVISQEIRLLINYILIIFDSTKVTVEIHIPNSFREYGGFLNMADHFLPNMEVGNNIFKPDVSFDLSRARHIPATSDLVTLYSTD